MFLAKGQNLPQMIELFPGLENRVYFYNPETKEFWFQAANVCRVLGFTNPTSALSLHCDDDEKLMEIYEGRQTWFVSEAGIYGLAMAAKTDQAKAFKRWLKHDVLPKLRSQGYYATKAVQEEMALILELLRMFNAQLDKVEKVRSKGVDLTMLEHTYDEIIRRKGSSVGAFKAARSIMMEIFSWVDEDCGDEHGLDIGAYRNRLTSAIERMQTFLGVEQLPSVSTRSISWSGFDDERLKRHQR